MLEIVPINLKELNTLVIAKHRHHFETQGHRFSIGVIDDEGMLVGACAVGRPVASGCDPTKVAEITRLVTDGTKNACSILYAAAARACRAMGFERIQTYILEIELGTSLKAAGWQFDGMTRGGSWNGSQKYSGKRRSDQPETPKQRWIKQLNRPRRKRVVEKTNRMIEEILDAQDAA